MRVAKISCLKFQIHFNLPVAGHVEFELYNMLGREVPELIILMYNQ